MVPQAKGEGGGRILNAIAHSGLVRKFRPGIASRLLFVLFVSRFHSPQKGRENLGRTGIKDGFEEIDHESSLGTFRQEKQDYLFKRSLAPGKFPLKRPKKSCSIYCQTELSRNVL